LEWVFHHLHQFQIPTSNDESVLPFIKPVGELALATEIISTYGNLTGQESIQKLRDFCWRELRGGVLLAELMRSRADLVILAAIYPAFRRSGMICAELEETLLHSLRLRGVRSLEFPPWRALELAITFAELGLESPWQTEDCLRRTWLYAMPEPWTICRSSAYSLTHTVFYITGFGANPQKMPDCHKRYLGDWVPVWNRYYLEISDYDLLCEMIMVLCCIGKPDEGHFARHVLAWQEPNGMVRGPLGSSPELLLTTNDPERNVFVSNYHTTLVALMAASMLLDRAT